MVPDVESETSSHSFTGMSTGTSAASAASAGAVAEVPVGGGLDFHDNALYEKAFGDNQHSYGCLAEVDQSSYYVTYNRDIDPLFPVPIYRIYVDVICPEPFSSTLVWLLEQPTIEVLTDNHMTLLVSYNESNRIVHWDRIYMWHVADPESGGFWIVSDVGRREDHAFFVKLTRGGDVADFDGGGRADSLSAFVHSDAEASKYDKEKYDAEHAMIASGELVLGVVMSASEDEPTVQGHITKLLEPEEVFPARLCGITGKYQPIQFMHSFSLFSVATILNGPATLVVQPEFWVYGWKPGDLIFMKMTLCPGETSRSLKRFRIEYVPKLEMILDDEGDKAAYCVLGTYIERSDDPEYHCCRIAAADCPSSEFIEI